MANQFDAMSMVGSGYLSNNPYNIEQSLPDIGLQNSSNDGYNNGLSLPGAQTIASEENSLPSTSNNSNDADTNSFWTNFYNNFMGVASGNQSGVNYTDANGNTTNYSTGQALAGVTTGILGGSNGQVQAAANSGSVSTGFFTDIFLRAVVIITGFIFIAAGLSQFKTIQNTLNAYNDIKPSKKETDVSFRAV